MDRGVRIAVETEAHRSLPLVDVMDRAPTISAKWLSNGKSSWFTYVGLVAMLPSSVGSRVVTRR
jgi:hypothetical protein